MFRRLFLKLFRPPTKTRQFTLDEEVFASLEMIADHHHTTPQAVAADLVQQALRSVNQDGAAWQCWLSLTPREKQVTALICLGFTSRQIAAKLNISPETVRTHARKILTKFGVPNRQVLREVLHGWDFQDWA